MIRPIPRPILLTGATLLAAYLAAMFVLAKPDGRVVFGDATHHFVQLRSIVYDRDLDLSNEYMRIYDVDHEVAGVEWIFSERTSTGLVRNYMPVGPALLWAPLYVLLSLAQWVLSWTGMAPAPDGYGRLLQMAPGITGILAATWAASIAWHALRTRVDDFTAMAAVLGVWLGSHAVYYTLVSPSYSHAPSMLTGALLFASWMSSRDRITTTRIAGWGALAGLAALMRWQDAIFLIVPAIEALRWPAPWRRRLSAAAAAGIAFLVTFSPQMIVWTTLYGQPLALPQGPSFMQWGEPHLWAMLFSDNHGLFSWAPLLVLSTAGLVTAMVREPAWRLPLAMVLLSSWYVNAAVADWWAGEAFGARRFLSLFLLFVLGLATWIGRRPEAARVWTRRLRIVVVLGALNWLLLLQYQLFMKGLTELAPYPRGLDLWLERFIVPFRLVAWLLG